MLEMLDLAPSAYSFSGSSFLFLIDSSLLSLQLLHSCCLDGKIPSSGSGLIVISFLHFYLIDMSDWSWSDSSCSGPVYAFWIGSGLSAWTMELRFDTIPLLNLAAIQAFSSWIHAEERWLSSWLHWLLFECNFDDFLEGMTTVNCSLFSPTPL